MGKNKVEQLATSQLMTYQQLLGLSNEQMDQFATDMVEFSHKGKVSERFAKEVTGELQQKVEANNKVLSQIEKELFSRVKKDFPESTLPNVIGGYMKRYHQELADQAKILADVKGSVTPKAEKPVKKPNFKLDD